ncbi:MAG: WXG100 family type VII secretion target [Butyrivibrio sp.]|nr:WXG100 family type VII secretion target [Butyrivibrio sp.]MBP3238607.1 WXG100 family type VII secretion target [Lachnospiraceae bacterium]
MDSIKVDTQKLRDQATKVEDEANDYVTTYEELYKDVETFTTTDYVGDEGNAFREQIEGFRDDFQKMKKLMEDYAGFLRTAAQSYDDTKADSISQIKSLQN